MKTKRISQTLLASAMLLAFAGQSQATLLSFPDFSSIDEIDELAFLVLAGAARDAREDLKELIGANAVLRVTPANYWQAGSAFSTNPISLASDASFSIAFQFRFTNPGGFGDGQGIGGDGLVFVVQTNANNVVGGGGVGIGYSGIPPALALSSTPGTTDPSTAAAAITSASTSAGV